jgi:hypothetical protein
MDKANDVKNNQGTPRAIISDYFQCDKWWGCPAIALSGLSPFNVVITTLKIDR